jgi:hypothetical protein
MEYEHDKINRSLTWGLTLYVGAAWINNAGHRWGTRMVTKSALKARYPTRGYRVSLNRIP